MQSHERQMRHSTDFAGWCEDATDTSNPARFARRAVLKAAVLRHDGDAPPATGTALAEVNSSLVYTVFGKILDVSPQLLVLDTDAGEQRFPLAASARAWRGGRVPPSALRQGDHAIVRRTKPGMPVLDRLWSEIGRVTGTIIERDGPAGLLVDEGPSKGRRIVTIGAGAAGRIQVRFPRLEPGYLIDVIGMRRDGFLEALIPATAQPPYLAGRPPVPPLVNGHVPDPFSGTAVWHEPGEEPAGLLGINYPALDPETSCEQAPAAPFSCDGDVHAVDPHAAGPGCIRLPYLSVGSMVQLRNDCAERARLLPVTGCGALGRLFCDRCAGCGPSLKGRIADLTMAAFVELGGNLDEGCFNATITLGG